MTPAAAARAAAELAAAEQARQPEPRRLRLLARERERPSAVVPIVVTVLLLLAALVAASPFVVHGAAVPARLALPPAYLLLAPLGNVLDAMSLLSIGQHAALLLTALALLGAWCMRCAFARGAGCWRAQRRGGGATLGILFLVYATGMVAPRPMAALQLLDRDRLAVDFHSHTDASWDGRRGFGLDANRAWHRGAGFDAAYVSDHASLDATERVANPARAGEGTMILPAVEVRCAGRHVVELHPSAADASADCDPGFWARSAAGPPDERPLVLLTIPAGFPRGVPLPPVSALEVADGAPRALGQMDRAPGRLRAIADSLGLTGVAGSNLHGWGHTATAWNVVAVPNWRQLDAAALDRSIRDAVRAHAVTVVERRRVAEHGIALAATAPLVAWNMLRTLSPAERASWLAWVWGAWLVAVLARRRLTSRARPATPARRPRRTARGSRTSAVGAR